MTASAMTKRSAPALLFKLISFNIKTKKNGKSRRVPLFVSKKGFQGFES